MTRQLSLLLTLIVLFSLPSIPAPAGARPMEVRAQPEAGSLVASPSPAYAPDRLLVKLRTNAQPVLRADGAWRTGVASLDHILAKHKVQAARRLFSAPASRGAVETPELEGIYLLHLPPGSDVGRAVRAFNDEPGVVWAEPDYLAYPTVTPNDPLLAQQWAVDKIGAQAAWDVTTGSPAVPIAIIDSGVDFDHPDLAGKLWVNPGEIAGGGDDDGNGYEDDVNGWDFVNGDNAPVDDHGHGTQVAGVAAAAADNGLGIAGVCWNCPIMPVKVMQASGVANYSDIAAGVLYAAQKGARVINLSLGGYSDSSALHAAIQAATGSYDAVVVAGAGNDGLSTPFYPAAYSEVLAVAGTDQADVKAALSNYGEWVDVSAPAADISTTLAGGDWGTGEGTSFATALVSGVAGLIRSQQPTWSQSLVGAQILHTADPIDFLNPSHPGLLGRGRLDAAAPLTTMPFPVLTISASVVNGDPQSRPVPGESSTLAITLGNDWLDAAEVTGILTTSDPHVTVSQGSVSFGTIAAGGTSTGSPPFAFTVAAAAGYSHPILFSLHVTASGGACAADLLVTVTTRSPDELVGGTIVADTIWTNDKRYIVTNNLGVAPGVTLTIEPGTEVRFNGDITLNVGGTLVANGTEAEPIWFRSHAGGSWNRIYFDDSSTDALTDEEGNYQSGNVLRWVQVEGASQGITCNSATPYLAHLTSTDGGMNCTLGATSLWLTHSELAGETAIAGSSEQRMGSWKSRADIPTPRWGLGAATATNGKIYAIGGSTELFAGNLATVEEYDPSVDTWMSRAAMPTARSYLGVVAAADSKLYAIGGYNGEHLATVEEYDPATDTWTTRTSMPTARSGLGVVAPGNGKIYAIGGDNGASLATVEEYDPATDTWAARASMPTARHYLGMAVAANGKIYAIGGVGGSAIVEEYDPATDTWATRTSMPTARSELGVATASNGKIYAVGGIDGVIARPIVEEYDPLTDTWTTRAAMPIQQWALGVAAATDGKIYAVSGTHNYSAALATVEQYTPPSDVYSCHVRESRVLDGNLALCDHSQVVASSVVGHLTAANGIVQDTTATGGISIGTGELSSNKVSGAGIHAGAGSVIRGNSVEGASDWAIQGSGTMTILANRLVGNAAGIKVNGGLVQGNLIANNNGTGLEVNGDSTVVWNTLTANKGSAIRVVNATSIEITGNNFEWNTGLYDIENLVPATALATIAAQENWWGTTDPTVIGRRIFDFYDDYDKGTLQFAPALMGPAQNAPNYVRSVTVTPESPVGIETVTFAAGFSKLLDQAIVPELSFRSVKHGTWTGFDPGNSALPEDVRAIAADPDGSLWFGTALGAVHFDGSNWTVFDSSNSGLPSGYVFAIASDPDGSHWFGTYGGGVAHFDRATWTVYERWNSGLPSDFVFAIASDPDGSHWFGTHYGGVAHFDGATWTVFDTSNSGLPDNDVNTIVIDPDGSTWFGTSEGGVAHFDGTTWTIYNSSNSSLPSNEVFSIFTDPDGTHWFGTARGVAHLGTRWAVYDSSNSGLPANEVYGISQGRDGSHWFGVYGARVSFRDSTWIVYNTHKPGCTVGAIISDRDGSQWFTTNYEGVYALWNYPAYVIEDNFEWLNGHNYRAAYDITSLVPRGEYLVHIAGATGTDGIEVAPTAGFTFTVDYAGAISDVTPPSVPAVEACAATNVDTLSASWSASDSDSLITLYSYAIGTTPGGAEVINWTNTTAPLFERTGLGLLAGQTYYIAVQARNEGGLWSEAGVPEGIVAGSGTCTTNKHSAYLPLITGNN